MVVGDLVVDPRRHVATRGGRELELTRREFDLLEVFARHPGQVLSRDQLLEQVWGYTTDVETNVVDVFVGYLRRKLEAERRAAHAAHRPRRRAGCCGHEVRRAACARGSRSPRSLAVGICGLLAGSAAARRRRARRAAPRSTAELQRAAPAGSCARRRRDRRLRPTTATAARAAARGSGTFAQVAYGDQVVERARRRAAPAARVPRDDGFATSTSTATPGAR